MRNIILLYVITLVFVTAPSYGQTVSREAKWSRWTDCLGSSSGTQQRLRTQTETRVCPTVIPLTPCGQCPKQCPTGEVDHLGKRTKCTNCRVVTQSCTCPQCTERLCPFCKCPIPPTISFVTLVCSPERKWVRDCGSCPDHCSVVIGDLDSPIGCERCNNESLVCGSTGEWIQGKSKEKNEEKQRQPFQDSSKISFGK